MAKAQSDEPTRWPSNEEKAYEARRAEGFASESRTVVPQPVDVYAPFAVKGNDTTNFVGVSPEYMTYAGVGGKPLRAEGDGPLAQVEAEIFDNSPVVKVTASPKEDTTTQGEGAGSELVYTATSGQGFVTKVATPEDAEKPENPVETETNPEGTAGPTDTARNSQPATPPAS